MPELPEVETIARSLNNILPGRIFQGVTIRYSGCLKSGSDFFQSGIANQEIKKVWRRGKLVLINLNKQYHIVFHLKMSGQLLYGVGTEPSFDKHTHLIFRLNDQGFLYFHDTRKFGYCYLLSSDELDQWPYFASLGPEPLGLESEEFVSIFRKSRARIKSVLLDQSKISGIGNIYADEALHESGIHPATPCCRIDQDSLKALSSCLQRVLHRSIKAGGTTLRDYMDSLGNFGAYQNDFMAYGRKGLPCKTCSTSLESCKVAGRTTVYCPKCQPLLNSNDQ